MNTQNAAVLVIDMQDFFLKHFKEPVRETLIKNQIKVLRMCARHKIPIFVIEYECLGINRGPTTAPLRSVLKTLPAVVQEPFLKQNNSAFTDTNLDTELKKLKVKTLVLMGINANGCIQDTAISALNQGYRIITSLETMASASRGDFGLSKQNRDWYQKKTTLLVTSDGLIRALKR